MSMFSTNSTKPLKSAGSAVNATRYDAKWRQSELTDREMLQDYTFVASIVEVNQQLQVYRIRVSGLADMTATSMNPCGQGISLGSRTSTLYGVGTQVLAMTTPALGVNRAIILGALAGHLGETKSYGSPELTVSSPVGASKDKISDQGLLNSVYNNFNGGSPVDSYPGDTTILNVLGGGLIVGPLQTSLVSGMDCALELHYIDSLVRLSSFNFEHSTAGSETLMFADVGDYTEVKRLNPYVVESLGGSTQYGDLPKVDATNRSESDDGTVVTGKYKPELESQIGWWRFTEFEGYLANLKLSFVTAPIEPKTRSSEDVDAQDEAGLFREHVDVTGAYTVVSAKSISLIKDCFIPVPKEHYRPDDSRGDKSADVLEARNTNKDNLADYTIEGIEEGAEHAALLYSAASADAAAFKTHRSTVNFRERANDWTFREIDEIDLAGFKSIIASTGFISAANGVTSSRLFAKLPQVGKLKINAREEVKYFASRSMVMLHEDGSVHIQDGYGSTISMRAGGIDFSCPGDITLRPGRNLVALAGDSVSCIAGNDVELASNLGDIRLQADRNVSVMAGNDGLGGILLETKAQASILTSEDEPVFVDPNTNKNAYRGIWLKASESIVGSVAQEVYIGNSTDSCKVHIDSGDTNVNVVGASCVFGAKQVMFATNLTNADQGTVFTLNNSGIGLKTKGAFLLQASSFLASGFNKDLQFLINGTGFFSKDLIAKSFAAVNTTVGKILGTDLDAYTKSVISSIDDQSEAISEIVQVITEEQTAIKASVVGKKTTSLKYLTFCYPDSTLRGIPESALYVLFESDWQQQYRNQGAGAPMLIRGVDPAKKAGAVSSGVAEDKSYFWPGIQSLLSKFGKLESTSRYVDDKLRFKKEGFDNPVVLTPTALPFENNYTIITKNGIRSKD